MIDEFAHAFVSEEIPLQSSCLSDLATVPYQDLVPVEAARRDLQEKARMESWTLLSQHLRRYI